MGAAGRAPGTARMEPLGEAARHVPQAQPPDPGPLTLSTSVVGLPGATWPFL